MDNLTSRLDAHKDKAYNTSPKGKYYPYILHRAYLCGCKDEYIKVKEVPDSRPRIIQHTIVPPPKRGKAYQQTLERCPVCIEEFQEQKKKIKLDERERKQRQDRGEVQGSDDWAKDGFCNVLARQRFGTRPTRPVQWKDEGPENIVYHGLKSIHDKSKAERGPSRPHQSVPYAERDAKPNKVVDGVDGQTYVVTESVDPRLMPDPRNATIAARKEPRIHRNRSRTLEVLEGPKTDVPKLPRSHTLPTRGGGFSSRKRRNVVSLIDKSAESSYPDNVPNSATCINKEAIVTENHGGGIPTFRYYQEIRREQRLEQLSLIPFSQQHRSGHPSKALRLSSTSDPTTGQDRESYGSLGTHSEGSKRAFESGNLESYGSALSSESVITEKKGWKRWWKL